MFRIDYIVLIASALAFCQPGSAAEATVLTAEKGKDAPAPGAVVKRLQVHAFKKVGEESQWVLIDVPCELQPPAGHDVLIHHAIATGFQVFTCKKLGNEFKWTLKPDAKLISPTGKVEGTHFFDDGAAWKLNDGSKVVCRKVKELINPGACALLILKMEKSEGTGEISNAEFVLRLNTTGGVMPAVPANAANEGIEIRVPYTADYYFYAAARCPYEE